MRNILLTFALGLSLFPSVALRADDRNKHRYYDRDHKDWHEWSENENRAWDRFHADRRYNRENWERADRGRQREYWRWRHEHMGDNWDRR